MRRAIAVLAGLLLSGSAIAQTTPNWPLHYVPSPAEWSALWASKQDVAGGPFMPLLGGAITSAGSTTSRALADRAAERINVKDFGAVGNNIADDCAALTAAVNRANVLALTGKNTALYFPSGIYFTTCGLPTFVGGGSVIGDGPYRTWVRIDSGMIGDLFSWSESWLGAGGYTGTTAVIASNRMGPLITSLSVTGDSAASGTQNAFVFYDRNDRVVMRDVDVYYLHGACIEMGIQKNTTQAYLRESFFENVKCRNTGTATIPAVLVSSNSSTGGEATNEVDFYKLRIFQSASAGVVVSNPTAISAVRSIRFYGLQVEDNVGDGIDIGLASDLGQTSLVSIYGFECPTVRSGKFALNIDGGSIQTFGIHADGVGAEGGAGSAVRIGNARLVDLNLDVLTTTGNEITMTSTTGKVTLKGAGGSERNLWRYTTTGVARPLSVLRTPMTLSGPPSAGDQVGIAAMKVTTSGAAAATLTQDGAAVSATNCFVVQPNEDYSFAVKLIAHDATDNTKHYAWVMPNALVFEKVLASSVTVALGTPTILSSGTVTGAAVALVADTTNGCLNLNFTPPTSNTDTWNVSALITYAVAP